MSNVTGSFPYPNISATAPLTSLASYANSVTGDLFWLLMMLLVFGVSFISLKFKTNNNKALLTALYITTVISSLLSMIGLVSPDFVVFLWIVTGVFSVLVYWEGR